MKIEGVKILGRVAIVVVTAVAVVGCSQKADSTPDQTVGVGERTGAALDRAAEKTVDVTGRAVEKTGEVLGKAGSAVENTGANMQK